VYYTNIPPKDGENLLSMKMQVRNASPVRKLIEVFRRGCDFVPETVIIRNATGKLLNTCHTAQQCGLKTGDTIHVWGTHFSFSMRCSYSQFRLACLK